MEFSSLLSLRGLIVAHRGARSIAPENTLRALEESIGRCDFAEIDVLFSKEGVGVVIHDDTLERTTNVTKIGEFASRKPYRVCEFSLSELEKLNYGSRFYKDKSSKEPLLTLKHALEFIKANDMFLNIEVKDMHGSFSDEEVVKNISKEIKDSDVAKMVMLSSFRHEYLSMFKKELSGVLIAALVEDRHPQNLVQYLKKLQVDAYHFNEKIADKEIVKMLKEHGFFVGVYTVNDTVRAKELFEMGVNYIFSDSLYAKGSSK